MVRHAGNSQEMGFSSAEGVYRKGEIQENNEGKTRTELRRKWSIGERYTQK